jgi:hypothetical protein
LEPFTPLVLLVREVEARRDAGEGRAVSRTLTRLAALADLSRERA